MEFKELRLEKRKSGESFILLDNHKIGREMEAPSTLRIEAGGIVQVKYHGRRIGLRITKAAGYEFLGEVFTLEYSNERSDDLGIGDYMKFNEENIFGYEPPLQT
jgi:hypothetical protein